MFRVWLVLFSCLGCGASGFRVCGSGFWGVLGFRMLGFGAYSSFFMKGPSTQQATGFLLMIMFRV